MDHLEKRKQELGKFQDSDMRRAVIMKVKSEIRGHKEAMLNREKDDIYETAYENLTKELIYGVLTEIIPTVRYEELVKLNAMERPIEAFYSTWVRKEDRCFRELHTHIRKTLRKMKAA